MKLRLLYDKATVEKQIDRLAAEIKAWLPKDEEVVCFCVLRGAVMFFADLMRALEDYDNIIIDFIALSSYEDAVNSSGRVKLIQDIREDIRGKTVLILEDIIDSGHTIQYLRRFFASKNVKDLKIACLLDKPCRKVEATADYTAFILPSDKFIVGYGLDANQKYRHLNGIYEMLAE